MRLQDCSQPWYEMQLDYHQTIRPCCFYKNETDKFDFSSDTELDIKKIWNSSYFQNYRKIIVGHEKDPQGCEGCEWIIGQKNVQSDIIDKKGGWILKFLIQKMRKFINKNLKIKSLP